MPRYLVSRQSQGVRNNQSIPVVQAFNEMLSGSNCFEFMTGVKSTSTMAALRPESGLNFGNTRQEWMENVTKHFSAGNDNWRLAVCWPQVGRSKDYHWAFQESGYWLEQRGQNGNIYAWPAAEFNDMVQDIYDTFLYEVGTMFVFMAKIPSASGVQPYSQE